jgi:hypothetical protein
VQKLSGTREFRDFFFPGLHGQLRSNITIPVFEVLNAAPTVPEMREASRANSLLNTIYGKAELLSNRERGEFTHRGGYASKSKERSIW